MFIPLELIIIGIDPYPYGKETHHGFVFASIAVSTFHHEGKMTDPAGHQDSHLCSPREKAFHMDRHGWGRHRFWEALRHSIAT
jgi:hypothetical protein